MTRILHLEIDSRLDCIELLSDALYGLCRRLPATEVDRITLALVEAVNNVVEHAYRGAPGHAVRVEVEWAADRLELRVRDQGQPMAPQQWNAAFVAPDPADPETWTPRSRGLFIIRNCMDAVHYATRDGVNTLTMIRRLTPDASAEPGPPQLPSAPL